MVSVRQGPFSGIVGALLQTSNNIDQGVAIIFGSAKSVDHPLKAQMKRHCCHIDIASFGNTIGRGRDRLRDRDRIPDLRGLVITELDSISAARLRDGDAMVSSKRFHAFSGLFTAVARKNPEMHLAIGRWFVPKRSFPIDFPINEKRMWIACDSKEDGPPIRAWKFSQVFVITRPATRRLFLRFRRDERAI